jgi:hypothetical protein
VSHAAAIVRRSSLPVQVTLPSGFVGERIEDGERGGSHAQGNYSMK